jgi:hypothetical protein
MFLSHMFANLQLQLKHSLTRLAIPEAFFFFYFEQTFSETQPMDLQKQPIEGCQFFHEHALL